MSSSKPAIDPSGTEKILSNPELVEFIANEASTYASTHGLLMKQDEKTYMHAPCTLLPTPIPEAAFELAKSLAPDFNLLVEAVSKDADFMLSSLSSVAKADDFLRRLVEIYTTVQREGPAQPVSLGVHRSDYMLQEENEAKGIAPHFLQVEINTISAGFACLSAVVTEMHRYLIERHLSPSLNLAKVPVNSSRVSVVNGLAAATKLHPNPKAVVVMVIQPGERNVADQRWLEYTLWDLHKIPMIRRTFLEIHSRGQLDPNTKDIVIDGHTAGLFYFRSGYGPKDYTSDKEWETLLRIERSRAVKCPTVAYHLAGCKKIQQELARPGVVERYLPAEAAARVRKCFAGLWGLEHDDAVTKAVIQDAIANPNDYVLKPQRNGGGNNLWGDEISHALSTLSVEDRSAYILMKKITPVISRNALMRGGSASVGDTIFELGMYSTFLGGGGKVLINEYAGHLLRTKFAGVNEGGVAAGFSCLDAPFLVPGAPITLSN